MSERKRRRNRDCCIDCGVNTSTIGEYYMLRDDVWDAAVPDGRGMFCVGCVEARLHRRLTATDFKNADCNFWRRKSPRLMSRLYSEVCGDAWRNAQEFVDCQFDDVIAVLRRDRRIAALSTLELELLLEDVRFRTTKKFVQLIRDLSNLDRPIINEIVDALGGADKS